MFRCPRSLRGRRCVLPLAFLFVGALELTLAVPAAAQRPATVTGTVVAETGEPLGGASVRVEGTDRGAFTDARGRFTIAGLPDGSVTLVVHRIGFAAARRDVRLGTGAIIRVSFTLAEEAVEMAGVVVSATRELRLKSQTPASVGVISGQELRDAKPAHPADIAGRVPGVWVSAATGEGHFTAIRQPRSTKPMYLFLEDGLPTRSTGFFNHNALYEINVPQADRLEVLKGPATALYGSDAIGGVINVETRRPALQPQTELSLETGSNGWLRALVSGSGSFGDHGLRADLNVTRSDGFRDHTAYDRQSGTVRWDAYLPRGASLKTVATYSRIDQADASTLGQTDFLDRPEVNYTPIAFRRVEAFRLSSALELLTESALLSLTPFFRSNMMELLPTWMLSYDPVVYNTDHRSYGVLARYRRDLPFRGSQLIAGVDVEHSPGQRLERVIAPTRVGQVYTGYSEGEVVYDYDVAFRGVSPYVQAELAPSDRLRLSAGLRYDHVGYDYENHLDAAETGMHRRPESTEVRYDHLSPKLGMTYAVARALGVFASYRHGFRAPSEGQLFRQGSSRTGVGLEPVEANSYEIGVRGEIGTGLSYETSVYRMDVSNDILTYVTRTDGVVNRININAGATRHEGIEFGVGLELSRDLRLDASYSNAVHTYRQWAPNDTEDFAGKRMEAAPRELVNGRLTYSPAYLSNARFGLEWVRIGRYFTDPANEHEYAGHDVFNLRGSVALTNALELVGQLNNLRDTRYAEGVSYSAFLGDEFSPGRPRSLNVGIQYRWQR